MMQFFAIRPRLIVLPRHSVAGLSVPRIIVIVCLTAGAVVGGDLVPAWAQTIGGMPASPQVGNPSALGSPTGGVGPAPQVKGKSAEPEALPGSAARSDRVAPAQGTPITNPTDALFDAINRGDMGAARDAIDRGADLGGHDVLGMTPIDLSVDLGRNDITFLLLSMANGESRPHRGASQQTAQTGKPAPGHGATPGRTSTSARTTTAARVPAGQSAKPTAPVAIAAPRLFADDGGAPNPGVGFLGFDNRH